MFQGCKNLFFATSRLQLKIQGKCSSTLSKTEAISKRNFLYEEEKKRQRAVLGRIEKIEVKYQSPVDEVVLVMNKDISTPHDCAKHISEGVSKVSALALVDGSPWDMHRPLPSNCTLKFMNLQSPPSNVVNTAFWRTCSFMLGTVINSAFKSEIKVHLHSFPAPVIQSGSFVYNVYINLSDWKPTDTEMRAMSAEFVKLANRELPIERLQTSEDVALEMFQDNPFKLEQIPSIAENNDNKIVLYKVGDHIDISKGPMVGNTSLVGRCTITAVHKIESDIENIYKFQGVALPKGVRLNSFAYSILENRARKLNSVTWMPQTIVENIQDQLKMSAKS